MIIPARWYSGGKGLDDFRKLMLNEHRLKEIHDFPDTSDCFPGINIRGGICYFHWQYDFNGDCTISNYKNGVEISRMNRPLLEEGMDVFIRYNEAISILRKVKSLNEESFSELVSAHKAFGLRTFVKGEKVSFENSIKLYQNGGIGFVKRDVIVKNEHLIDKWKVIVPYSSPGDDSYPHLILSKPLVSEPNSCCTETYLVVGPFDDELSARNVVKYMCSSFVRFLILLLKPSQHVTQKTYQLVPKQDFKNSWSDAELFEKYNLNKSEIELIASLIKPINI